MMATRRTRCADAMTWRDVGASVRAVRRSLADVSVAARTMLPTSLTRRVEGLQERFEALAREIEYEMFRVGGPQDLSIFRTGFGVEPVAGADGAVDANA